MNSRRFKYWKAFQSLMAFLFFFSILRNEYSPEISVFLILLYVNIIFLFLTSGKEIPRIPNWITLLRALGTVPLIFLPPEYRLSPVLLFAILVFLALTDLADGYAARRLGVTIFGSQLDEETDALFTLVLSFLLYRDAGFNLWILIFGILRYFFVFFFLIIGTSKQFPAQFKRFSRLVCAITVSCLIGGFVFFLPFFLRAFVLAVAFALLLYSFMWETWIHLTTGPAGRYLGLFHSMFIYYFLPFKSTRMTRLYSEFLKPGSLAFDIGSHVGNRIGVWSRLGATVVALEPNPSCMVIIRRLHGKRDNLTLIPSAVGKKKGIALLYSDPLHPTLGTLSRPWIDRVKKTEPFHSIQWTEAVETEVTTLDELITIFGIPDFCKIDVEGFELEVLLGLSSPLPALSVEYLPSAVGFAHQCLDRILFLGNYEFNLSRRETMKFLLDSWGSAEDIRQFLSSLELNDSAGDIYARLKS